MIERLVGICSIFLGLSVAGPISRKGAYAPAPPGERPSCATKGMTFCEEVDKYPTKLIQKLLQTKSLDVYDFFVDESEGLDEPPDYVLHQEVLPTAVPKEKSRKTRSADGDSSESALSKMCSVPAKKGTPKIASNSRGEWRFVGREESVKLPQQFAAQVCDDKEECRKSCKQFFSPVSVKSTDPAGKVVDDIFWMPSSCRCFDEEDNVI